MRDKFVYFTITTTSPSHNHKMDEVIDKVMLIEVCLVLLVVTNTACPTYRSS
jgi:hypothetical protein